MQSYKPNIAKPRHQNQQQPPKKRHPQKKSPPPYSPLPPILGQGNRPKRFGKGDIHPKLTCSRGAPANWCDLLLAKTTYYHLPHSVPTTYHFMLPATAYYYLLSSAQSATLCAPNPSQYQSENATINLLLSSNYNHYCLLHPSRRKKGEKSYERDLNKRALESRERREEKRTSEKQERKGEAKRGDLESGNKKRMNE